MAPSAHRCYWQHRLHRRETMAVTLHGQSEFEAHSVTFTGPQNFEVPDGFRMLVTQGAAGELREELIPLNGRPSWHWEYSLAEEQPVSLTFTEGA